MQAEQTSTEGTLHQLQTGQRVSNRSPKFVEIDRRIQTLTEEYMAIPPLRTKAAFLRGIGYNLATIVAAVPSDSVEEVVPVL